MVGKKGRTAIPGWAKKKKKKTPNKSFVTEQPLENILLLIWTDKRREGDICPTAHRLTVCDGISSAAPHPRFQTPALKVQLKRLIMIVDHLNMGGGLTKKQLTLH